MNITSEQADQLDQEQCEQLLKKLARKYPLQKEYVQLAAEIQLQADTIANSLLYLEDRIRHIEMTENLERANAARWSKE